MDFKIVDAKKDILQENNTPFLDVTYEILDGSNTLETRKRSFDIAATPDEIKAEIAKDVEVFAQEQELAIKNKEADEADKAASDTIENLLS
jgi:hypothetical protein